MMEREAHNYWVKKARDPNFSRRLLVSVFAEFVVLLPPPPLSPDPFPVSSLLTSLWAVAFCVLITMLESSASTQPIFPTYQLLYTKTSVALCSLSLPPSRPLLVSLRALSMSVTLYSRPLPLPFITATNPSPLQSLTHHIHFFPSVSDPEIMTTFFLCFNTKFCHYTGILRYYVRTNIDSFQHDSFLYRFVFASIRFYYIDSFLLHRFVFIGEIPKIF